MDDNENVIENTPAKKRAYPPRKRFTFPPGKDFKIFAAWAGCIRPDSMRYEKCNTITASTALPK